MNANLTKNILFCIIVAVLFVPIIISPSLLFPYITGKNFIFRILVEIGLVLGTILAIRDASFRVPKNLLLISYTAFITILAVADLFGVNPARSVWSSYERMEGFMAHIHIFGYFILLFSTLTSTKLWNRFFAWSLLPNIYVVIYALLQWCGWDGIQGSGGRIDATLGNAAYLAAYVLFYIAISIIVFLRSEKGSYVRYVTPVLAGLNLFILLETYTRGTFLGLFAGLFVGAVLIIMYGKEYVTLRKFAVAGIVALLVSIPALLLLKGTAIVQKSTLLNRITSISFTDLTAQSRLKIWQMSYEGFKEHPLLGWGQDNFLYVFAEHYNPSMYNQEPWFDRSHNVFFDWLIAGGILGLLAYLSLFMVALYFLWFRSQNSTLSFFERVTITALLVAYFVHNFFVFDNITSYILFAVFLAFVGTQVTREESVQKKERGESLSSDVLIASSIGIAFFGLLCIYFINIKPFLAATDLIEGMNMVTIASVQDARVVSQASLKYYGKEMTREELLATSMDDFELAIDRATLGRTEAREQLIQNALQINANQNFSVETKKAWAQFGFAEIKDELANDPDNVRILHLAGSYLNQLGNPDLALLYLTHAVELAPNKQLVAFDLGLAYLLKHDMVRSLQEFKRIYDLDHNYDAAYARYIYALYRAGETTTADKEAVLFRAKFSSTDPQTGKTVLTISDFDTQIAGAKLDAVVSALNKAIDTNDLDGIATYSAKLIQINPDTRAQLPAYIAQRRLDNAKKK